MSDPRDDGFSSLPPFYVGKTLTQRALAFFRMAEESERLKITVPPCVENGCMFLIVYDRAHDRYVYMHMVLAGGLKEDSGIACDGLWFVDDTQIDAKHHGDYKEPYHMWFVNEKHPAPILKPFDQVGLTALPESPTSRQPPPQWRAEKPREYFADRADPRSSDAATVRPRTPLRELAPEVTDAIQPTGGGLSGGAIGPGVLVPSTPPYQSAAEYRALHEEAPEDSSGLEDADLQARLRQIRRNGGIR